MYLLDLQISTEQEEDSRTAERVGDSPGMVQVLTREHWSQEHHYRQMGHQDAAAP